jgi:hypothetical protein
MASRRTGAVRVSARRVLVAALVVALVVAAGPTWGPRRAGPPVLVPYSVVGVNGWCSANQRTAVGMVSTGTNLEPAP